MSAEGLPASKLLLFVLLLPASCCSGLLAVDKHHQESWTGFYLNHFYFPSRLWLQNPGGKQDREVPPGRSLSYCLSLWEADSYGHRSHLVFGECEHGGDNKGFNMLQAIGPILYQEPRVNTEPRCVQVDSYDHAVFGHLVAAVNSSLWLPFSIPQVGLKLGKCSGKANQQFSRSSDGKIHLASYPGLCVGSDLNYYPFRNFAMVRSCYHALSFSDDFEPVSVLWQPYAALKLLCSLWTIGSLALTCFFLAFVRKTFQLRMSCAKARSLASVMCWRTDRNDLPIMEHANKLRIQHAQQCLPVFMSLCAVALVIAAEEAIGIWHSQPDVLLHDANRSRIVGLVTHYPVICGIPCSAAALVAYWRSDRLSAMFLDCAHAYFFAVWMATLWLWARCGSGVAGSYQQVASFLFLIRFTVCYVLGNWRLCALLQTLTSLFDMYLVAEHVTSQSTFFWVGQVEYTNAVFVIVLTIVMATFDRERWSVATAIRAASEAQHSVTLLLDTNSNGFCDLMLPEGTIGNASQKMHDTFGAERLSGLLLGDFVQEADIGLLNNLYAAARHGLELEPVLLTCTSLSNREGDVELFDVRVVPYSRNADELSVCFSLQGERRALDKGSFDTLELDLLDTSVSEAVFRQAPPVSGARAQFPNSTQWAHPPRSAVSAPTNPIGPAKKDQRHLADACSDQRCLNGDCFPEDAEVNVLMSNGQEIRKKVADLQASDSVWCYDHLSRGSRYAAVKDVSINTGPCHWVRLKLEDGTHVEVTADHPMRTEGDVCSPMRKACDLQPGKDEVMVARTLPIRLEAIETWQDSLPRVSVTLAQSMRFSMFVLSPGQQTVAVALESADYIAHKIQVKNSFIDAMDGQSAVDTHAASAPPGFSGFHFAPSQCNSSDRSSSVSGNCDDVLLVRPDEKVAATLSAYRELKVSGHASIGSYGHNDFACMPCRFERKHQADPTNVSRCMNLQFCTFCHAEHSDGYWKACTLQNKYNKKKAKRKANRPGSICAGEGDVVAL